MSCAILLVDNFDVLAGFATAVFVNVINQMIYARRFNLVPWVSFQRDGVIGPVYGNTSLISRYNLSIYHVHSSLLQGPVKGNDSYIDVRNDGIWEHYFEPTFHVQTHRPSKCSRTLTLVKNDLWVQAHTKASWVVRSWKYKIGDVDKKFGSGSDDAYDENWYFENRLKAHSIVSNYFRPKAEVLRHTTNLISSIREHVGSNNFAVLGIHLRGSDKGNLRRIIPFEEYVPYITAFMSALSDKKGVIFLATDDSNYQKIALNSTFASSIFYFPTVLMSDSRQSTFQKYVAKRHKVNMDVLNDIIMLSHCNFLLHGHSAVSEAAIYMNLRLHSRSVNLEFKGMSQRQHTPDTFRSLVEDWKNQHY